MAVSTPGSRGMPFPTVSFVLRRRAHWWFLLPALAAFSFYVVYPIFESMWLSLFAWDGISEKQFVGFANYVELFNDPRFWVSIRNNVLWLLFFMLAPPMGLALAIFLNQQIRGIRLAKALFFFPFVLAQVVIGLVYTWFYDPTNGLLNAFLGVFGLGPVNILADEDLVTYGIIAAGLWPQVAYCMVLYLTGLNNVNPELIEAARLDRARGWRLFWHVVLPQLRPATFIAIVVTTIGALRSFDLVAIMTQGGPYHSSSVLAWFMYEQAITNYRMGYGAAIATVLFLIMDVYIALFLWRMLRAEKT